MLHNSILMNNNTLVDETLLYGGSMCGVEGRTKGGG